MDERAIGVFDSGVGGLSVLSACRRLLPCENFIYLSDFANSPYGNKCQGEILRLSLNCVDRLIHNDVKAVVIACNTATNVGAAELRRRHDFPIIGLEPAIKPAFEQCNSGRILVLCTCATARQDKFLRLLSRFDTNRAIVAPQEDLARLIECNICCLGSLEDRVADILSQYSDVGAVVLGCTHYVFIKDIVETFYGGRVAVFDGNDGAAHMLKRRLIERGLTTSRQNGGNVLFIGGGAACGVYSGMCDIKKENNPC